MNIQFVIVLNLLLCVFCDEKSDNDGRTLSAKLNPDCERQIGTECQALTVLHIEAESDANKLHYIWDFTGSPSLFLAETDKNATLSIDWSSFMAGAVNAFNFSSTPNFVFSAVIKNILLFQDAGDKADVNDESVKEVTIFNPHFFNWTQKNYTEGEKSVELLMIANVTGTNGSVAVKVSRRSNLKDFLACG